MKKYALFSVLFLLALAAPAILIAATPDRDFSDNENRVLHTAPALTGERVLGGTFQSGLEEWLADQFPARDTLMAAGTTLKKAVGYRDVGGAYLGRDGWYPEMHTPESFDLEKYRRNLGYLAQIAAQANVPATALLIPCAASVMNDCLPTAAQSYDAHAAYAAAREALGGFTLPDLPTAFEAHRSEELYYRTDHHWTAAGARLAYDCLNGGKGAYRGTSETFCEDFYGTTYSKTLDPAARPDTVEIFTVPDTLRVTADGEEIALYDREAAARKDKYTVFFGGNHGLVRITGGCENGKTLLVLKDSFANSFAPLLTADYETILLVDLRYYPGSVRTLIAGETIDELLLVYEMSNLASGDDFVKLLL